MRGAIVHLCEFVHKEVKHFFIGSNATVKSSPFSARYRKSDTSDYDITILPISDCTSEENEVLVELEHLKVSLLVKQ